MQIARVATFRFRLPFVRPVRVGRELLHERTGLVVAMTDDGGRTGYGEVAPLPGLDATPPEQCLDELRPLRERLPGTPFCTERFAFTAPLLGLLEIPLAASPHTLFGIESALLALWLQNGGAPAVGGGPRRDPGALRVPVNGLFVPAAEDDACERQLDRLRESGVTTVKVKIGRLPVETEIDRILALCARIGNGCVLRLDGNRNLSVADCRRYERALGHLRVEYAEEPLRETDTAAASPLRWPLALDESLAALLDPEEPDPAALPHGPAAIILKPGLLAGLHGMARCASRAQKAGIRTVLSSAFNTGITLSVLALFTRLAALPAETAHGFDTLCCLAGDLLPAPPQIGGGVLWIPEEQARGGWRPDPGRLREVDR